MLIAKRDSSFFVLFHMSMCVAAAVADFSSHSRINAKRLTSIHKMCTKKKNDTIVLIAQTIQTIERFNETYTCTPLSAAKAKEMQTRYIF